MTGTSGHFSIRCAAPEWKWPISLLAPLVPSGKMISDCPAFNEDSIRGMGFVSGVKPRRAIGKILNNERLISETNLFRSK